MGRIFLIAGIVAVVLTIFFAVLGFGLFAQ
jgi:hypothetical protein